MSKRSDAIAVMVANSTKPMSEVVVLIAETINVTVANAKSYYRYIVEHKLAPGTVEKTKRAVSDAKLEKQVKREGREYKAKLKAKSKEVSAASLLPSTEVAKIKAANLARMKEVSSKRKVYTNVARPEGDGVAGFDADVARAEVETILADESFTAPRFLNKAELKTLV